MNMEGLKAKYRKLVNERLESKANKSVRPITPPRYDDAFYKGLKWLDSLSYSDSWEGSEDA